MKVSNPQHIPLRPLIFWAVFEERAICQLGCAGDQVSVNDFIVRAAALALEQVPEANSRWDAKTGEIQAAGSVDVAIAVATDSGLITPIVKQANTKSLQQISREVRSCCLTDAGCLSTCVLHG